MTETKPQKGKKEEPLMAPHSSSPYVTQYLTTLGFTLKGK
jgi:hypothetical protein